jgi:dissimilatory sulfite reductase (desulfoviridin) alpha/beta subunit
MNIFRLECCRSAKGCKQAVANSQKLLAMLKEALSQNMVSEDDKAQQDNKIKQHEIFKVCVAGCANSCSQPQIKDFALIARVKPEFSKELCTLCGLCCTACREQGLQIKGQELLWQEDKCLGCGACWRTCPQGAIQPGEEKWRILIGGKLGRHPRLAIEVAETDKKNALLYLRRAIDTILSSQEVSKRIADRLFKEFA